MKCKTQDSKDVSKDRCQHIRDNGLCHDSDCLSAQQDDDTWDKIANLFDARERND